MMDWMIMMMLVLMLLLFGGGGVAAGGGAHTAVTAVDDAEFLKFNLKPLQFLLKGINIIN